MVGRRHTRGGYATVLAMLLLVLGLTFSAWLYSMVSNNTAMVRNEQLAARSMAAADSGLSFAMHHLQQAANSGRFRETDSTTIIIQKLGQELQKRSTDGVMPGTVAVDTDLLSVSDVAFGSADDTFGFEVAPGKQDDPSTGDRWLSIICSGQATGGETTTRTICLEVAPSVLFGTSALDYAIATPGEMDLAPANGAGVFRWNKGPTDDKGEPTDGAPSVLLFEGMEPPDYAPHFPPKYLQDEAYNNLNAMARDGVLSPHTSSTQNIYIAAPQGGKGGAKKHEVVFENCVLSGIVYVQWPWPTSITFGDGVTLNAAIVFAPPPNRQNVEAVPVIALPRNADMSGSVSAAHSAIRTLFAESSDAQELLPMLDNWLIHAPDATLEFETGNTDSQKTLQGDLHLGSIDGAGQGTGKGVKDTMVFYGQIICEKDIDITGNCTFSIEPPSNGDNADADRRLVLDVGNGAYWEKF